jgi:hypothetical protein
MKWMNTNLRVFVIIVMTTIFQGTSVRNNFFFMAMTEDVSEEEVDVSLVPDPPPLVDLNLPSNPPEVEPLISLMISLVSLLPKPSS